MNKSDANLVKGNPTESENKRRFSDGSVRSVTSLRSAAIALGTYKPGWRWSLHAGTQTGKPSENHIGYIISGNMLVQDSTGIKIKVGPGDALEVGPGHDAWVIGGEPCIALDFTRINSGQNAANNGVGV